MLNLIDFFSPCINTYITLLPVAATETLETPGTGKSINTHALVKRWWIQNMWAVIIINTSLCMLPPHPCFNYVYKMQTHKKVLALLVLSSISDSNIPLSKHFHFYQSVLYEMSGYKVATYTSPKLYTSNKNWFTTLASFCDIGNYHLNHLHKYQFLEATSTKP